MKTEAMKTLISDYVNEESFELDMSNTVLKRIKQSKGKPRHYKKHVLLIAVLTILFSTFTFATVLKVIELQTDNNPVKEVKIIPSIQETQNNDLWEGFSESDVPENLTGIPTMTINTEYPTHGIIRRGNYIISSYDELITSISNTQPLPQNIDEYKFEQALVGYIVTIPTDEALIALANKYQDSQFYTFELETQELVVDWYEYAHKTKSDAIYTIQPTKYSGERAFQENQLLEYEVIQLKSTEAFLFKRDNMDFSGANDKKSKDIIENNYQIFWQEKEIEFSIRPSRSTRIYPDFTNRKVYSYPEHTKENLIDLATKINGLDND